MSACVIELNDINLLSSVHTGVNIASPGYALLGGSEIVVGAAAQAAARRHPRQINNRFWQQLGLNPLSEHSNLARHHADLAYQHLLQVHQLANEPEEVTFAVPASFDRQQLAVLLGICQQCPFDAVGLLDLAVAAAASVELAGDGMHIDIQLHQAVITRFSVSAGAVAREEVRLLESCGLLALYNQFAHLIADAFIQQCRFDPLHDAHSEQVLYDALPQWLQQSAAAQEFVFEIPQGASVHKAKLARDVLLEPVQQLQQRIQQRSEEMQTSISCTLVTRRLLDLPGFAGFMKNCVPIPRDAVAEACQRHESLIRSDDSSLPFITRLPVTLVQPLGKLHASAPAQIANTATHILLNSTAFTLVGATRFVYVNGDDCLVFTADTPTVPHAALRKTQEGLWVGARHGAVLFINGKQAEQSQYLAKGDRFSLAASGAEASLIEVSQPDGTQT